MWTFLVVKKQSNGPPLGEREQKENENKQEYTLSDSGFEVVEFLLLHLATKQLFL